MTDHEIDAEFDAEFDADFDADFDRAFDAQLTARLRAAAIDDATVARLPLSPVLNDLAEEIMRTPAPVPTSADAPSAPITARRPMRRMRLVLAAAATAAAVLVGTAVVTDGGGGGTAFAAELVAVAEANQRILVDRDGWSVSRVDEFTAAEGEMTFSDGTHNLNLAWAPAAQYNERLAKHRQEFGEGSTVPVLGGEGRMFNYGGAEYETLLPPSNGTYVRFRGNVGDEATYRAVLGDMRTVDVNTWLSALPESAVKPGAQADAIDAMLKGVPLPAGFDRASIKGGEGVRDRYQLGAAVAGAVSCAWVHLWDDAVKADDDAAATQAVDAMATSRTWQVLLDMNTDGDYPEEVWMIADAMAGKDTGLKMGQHGTHADIVTAAESGLGCGN